MMQRETAAHPLRGQPVEIDGLAELPTKLIGPLDIPLKVMDL
jgi:hypothetical protein